MTRRREYFVVMDANVLIRDFWMTGPDFAYLIAHNFLEHHPIVPEIAFEEARAHLRERATALLANRNATGRASPGNTRRLLRLFNRKRTTTRMSWDVERLLGRWETHIKRTLRRFGGSVMPTPQVNISEIARRSIARQKPFSKGDRGFRDTVIWLSTLNLARSKACISFITHDVNDFFGAGGKEAHPELLVEAESVLGSTWQLLFFPSLGAFVAEFDSDRRTSSDALRRALLSNAKPRLDLWAWITRYLTEVLSDDMLAGTEWAGIPSTAEGLEVVSVDLVGLDIARIHHLSDETYRVYCDVAFVAEMEGEVTSDPEDVFHPRQIISTDMSHRYWTAVNFRAVGTVLVQVDYDASSNEIVGSFFLPLSHWTSYDTAVEQLEQAQHEVMGSVWPSHSAGEG